MKPLAYLLLGSLLLSGCASENQSPIVIQEPLEEIYDSKDIHQESGSLWNENNGSMFTDRKAQRVGDIVTVLISETSSASKEAASSTSRSTNMSASIPKFFGLENDDIWDGHNPIDLSNLVNADFSNGFDGSGTTSREEN